MCPGYASIARRLAVGSGDVPFIATRWRWRTYKSLARRQLLQHPAKLTERFRGIASQRYPFEGPGIERPRHLLYELTRRIDAAVLGKRFNACDQRACNGNVRFFALIRCNWCSPMVHEATELCGCWSPRNLRSRRHFAMICVHKDTFQPVAHGNVRRLSILGYLRLCGALDLGATAAPMPADLPL
ncbi:hypothetical protein SAMN04487976_101135 [Xaviernesmea oryzae]|nr:hypothetical protein SAMN04487976_101135 [Xaviernesmea oryzae]